MYVAVAPFGYVTKLAGSVSPGFANSFNYPAGITVSSTGVIYVSDSSNNMIRAITPTGVVTTLAGSITAGFLALQQVSRTHKASH